MFYIFLIKIFFIYIKIKSNIFNFFEKKNVRKIFILFSYWIILLANSPALYGSCLIEAYNLKAAIDYHLGNNDDAKECLNEMPPREDE